MRNPLTFRIESWLGSVLVLAFAAFFVGIFVIAVKNFGSDTETLSSYAVKLRTISSEEKALIDTWIAREASDISIKDVGYRFILQKYPDKPWLER